MLIETTEDFKRVKNVILKEGIQTITPHAGTNIKVLAYKDEMLFLEVESDYNKEVILNLKTGTKYYLSTAAEILMKEDLLNILDTKLVPRERANLLCAADKLPPEELEKALREAESILMEKKKRMKSNGDNVATLETFGLKDMYDKLVSDLDQGPVTYTFDAKTVSTKE
nr:MAG TPA: hypothetical protein [Caudoviricetes sp.]